MQPKTGNSDPRGNTATSRAGPLAVRLVIALALFLLVPSGSVILAVALAPVAGPAKVAWFL